MQKMVSLYQKRGKRQLMAIPFTLGLMLCSTFWALVVGAVPLSESDILTYVSHGFSEVNSSLSTRVLFEIRLPRTVLSLCVGGALGLCGAAMQALFRNPLADPSLIGVAGGGALGAVTVIVLGYSLWPQAMGVIGQYALPIGAMLGCLGVCAIIYRLSNRQGQFTIITLLLSGIAVNAIVGSLIGILTLVSSDSELRELTFWTMGNLGGNSWALILPVLVLIIISLIGLSRLANPLNLYLLGEAQAQHLGVSVSYLKKQVFIYTAMAVGAAVSISGMIGFVGFVVPHLVRILIGPDHRFLFPVSMLFGASFLTITDVIARIVIVPAELPIGLVTSALGGPFFLFVLYKQTGRY
ncbi:FecCD family ABC transporter permease [Marinomonas posidonica]|uniref:FecCD family ABC transporter permease n=1 Tax=Marinomonas posidonica TaxID=936476 RepID=UPI003736C5FC